MKLHSISFINFDAAIQRQKRTYNKTQQRDLTNDTSTNTQYSTQALGEEGGKMTTQALQETGYDPIVSTEALGEEGGDKEPTVSSLSLEEEGGNNDPIVTTMALSETGMSDDKNLVTLATDKEDNESYTTKSPQQASSSRTTRTNKLQEQNNKSIFTRHNKNNQTFLNYSLFETKNTNYEVSNEFQIIGKNPFRKQRHQNG